MELRDSFGRKIDYIRLSVTDRCNLRCIYCSPGGAARCSARAGRMPESGKVLSFLRVARKYGLKKVRITGGEPLLRKDIVSLVREIKAVGIEDLSLTTNGQLLPFFAGELKRAGLDRVNISLDSLRRDHYKQITGGGRLSGVLRAIRKAEKVFWPAPVKINMVPVRGINGGEIADFARLTLDNPFHVRFIELMPVGEATFNGMRITSGEARAVIRNSLGGKLLPLGRCGSSENYMLQGAKGVIGFISPISGHFCDSCNRLRITSEGRIRPCLFSAHELDLSAAGTETELEQLLLLSVSSKQKGSLLNKAVQFKTMQQVGG